MALADQHSLQVRISGLLDRTIARLDGNRERLRKFGFAAALIVFGVGLLLAVRATPVLGSELQIWPLLLLTLLSAPLGTILNTVELHALSRIARGPMSWRTSAELTVYTSAANMLPLPGGVVTKLAGMKAHGVSYGTASAMVVLSFLAWAGFTFLLSGCALFVLGQPAIATLFGIVGVALLIVCGIGYARYRDWRRVAIIALLRMVYFAVEVLRYWLAFATIGVSLSLMQCATFVVASVVGAAVVIAPQGLGISEASAALLATLIGVGAGMAFIAAALQRVVRLVGLSAITALFIAFDRTWPGQRV